jgi:hypothetical protein
MITRLWKEIRALQLWFVLVILTGVTALVLVHFFSAPAKIPTQVPPGWTPPTQNFREMLWKLHDDAWNTYDYIIVIFMIVQTLSFYLAACVLFGAEFQSGSMQRLLTQPLSRNRIWLEKSFVLILLITIGVGIDYLLNIRADANLYKIENLISSLYPSDTVVREGMTTLNNFRDGASRKMFLCGLMALSTAPTLSLWLRQSHITFWASLVLPIVSIICLGIISQFIAFCCGFSCLASLLNSGFVFLTCLWFAIMYPIGWYKFRRLEV